MKASVFVTCLVDQFAPRVGIAMVQVLRRLGVQVDFPEDQTCCGQPGFNTGFHREARDLAVRFLRVFERSEYLVTPSGSCAAMVRNCYPRLFREDSGLLEQSRAMAAKTFEFSDFLVNVLHTEDVGARFDHSVAVQFTCHMLRELGIRDEPLRLLRSVKGIRLRDLSGSDICCGFGGLFSLKFPDLSGAILREKIDSIRNSKAEVIVANDFSCMMHMAGGLSRQGLPTRVMHLAEVLAQTGS